MPLPAEVARAGHRLARRTGLDPADGESFAGQAWVEHPECWFVAAYRDCIDEARRPAHQLDTCVTVFEDWNSPADDGGLGAAEDRAVLGDLLASLNDADMAALARRYWLGLPADDTACARALRRTRAGVGHRSPLSPREVEVVTLAADGLTRAAIGSRLGIAPDTVKSHLWRITRRLGAADTTHVVAIALRAGWIT